MEPALKIQPKTITSIESSILKTLCYFDIFHYPITATEIIKFSEYVADERRFFTAIKQLVDAGVIFQFDKFYCLENNFSLVKKRIDGNKRAEKIFPRAKRIGVFLSKFPFVRAVGISGSLSKNVTDKKDDIDFFIITKANRLWIARTFMHLFKKLTYLFRMQHLFCMNYYIDETLLEIHEKNIYTATEVKTLVSLSGEETLNNFFATNHWTDKWLPNFQPSTNGTKHHSSMTQKIFEWIFDNRVGDRFDNYLFSVTSKRWIKKESAGKKNMKGRTMTLLTGKHFAKSNPDFFQERIIQQYHFKIEALKNKWPDFF